MPSVSVLMKPASGMCNMKCEYCFYCDEMGVLPANLLRQAKKPLSREELDVVRADFLRARLPEIN